MMPRKQMSIAVIGDEDLVNGLRLGGVRKYHAIQESQGTREEVRGALATLIDDPEAGIIVISEDYMQYVGDLVTEFKQKGNLTPIILEVPSKYGTKYQDVAAYYKAHVSEFIGFEIEI